MYFNDDESKGMFVIGEVTVRSLRYPMSLYLTYYEATAKELKGL